MPAVTFMFDIEQPLDFDVAVEIEGQVGFDIGVPARPGAAVALVVGPAGPVSGSTISRIAGENLGGHRVVKIGEGSVVRYVSPADVDVEATAGITTGAATTGGTATIQISGPITEASWNWQPGSVWLADAGILTQTPPEEGSVFRVGTAIGPTTIIIDPRLIAQL